MSATSDPTDPTARLEAAVVQLQGEVDEIREALVTLLLEAKRRGWRMSGKGWDTEWKV